MEMENLPFGSQLIAVSDKHYEWEKLGRSVTNRWKFFVLQLQNFSPIH